MPTRTSRFEINTPRQSWPGVFASEAVALPPDLNSCPRTLNSYPTGRSVDTGLAPAYTRLNSRLQRLGFAPRAGTLKKPRRGAMTLSPAMAEAMELMYETRMDRRSSGGAAYRRFG